MDAYHNSHDLYYREPFGAVPAGTAVRLHIDAEDIDIVPSCALVLWRDGAAPERVPMTPDGAGFTVTVMTPAEGALLWYCFELTQPGGSAAYYGNNISRLGGPGRLYDGDPAPYQLTVYEEDAVPAWFTGGIVYQIFPDRFHRGSDWEERRQKARRPEGWRGPARVFQEDWADTPFYTKNTRGEVTRWAFFGGTLEGVREKLLYIKSLGASAIYLNPIFLAASNHKYDTADYTAIDPGFGDEESFRRLAREARALGIALILDGVFAHTGADSVYFNKYGNYGEVGAITGPSSPYYEWYRFNSFPDSYDSWWGVSDLPKTDKNNKSFREFICGADGVVRRWLRLGARGWRLDVADELPDDFIRGVRRAMTETDRDSVLVGEVWEDASNKVSYGVRRSYLLGGALQSVMNYPFRLMALDYMLGKLDAPELAARLMNLRENYPPSSMAMALNVIGSHDRARVLTLLGDPPESLTEPEKEVFRLSPEKLNLARARLKLLALLQSAVPGVPCVYYGDEAGLEGFEDPYNRAPYPWGREDMELREHYRLMGLLRQQNPALREGGFAAEALSPHVLSATRATAVETLRLIVNRGIFEHETVVIPIDAGYVLDLLTSEELRPEDGRLTLTLEPLTARLLCLRSTAPSAPETRRAAGILCALSSIPSFVGGDGGDGEDGRGTTRGSFPTGDGSEAVSEHGGLPTLADILRFVDFLADGGQRLWQLLPLNPPGKGGSPFYSTSLFALGETVPISDIGGDEDAYRAFCRENAYWLDDDALYTALRIKNGNTSWQSWPEDERWRTSPESLLRAHQEAVEKYKREQFGRHRTWLEVKAYANSRGLTVIGDLPIYAAPDSADVWARQSLFRLDGDGRAALHAGVPPDYFSPEGQNWGNPLYDWDNARNGLYAFWEMRFRRALNLYDVVRVDHFRSFSAYFAIPGGAPPSEGHWLAGPGPGFFDEMRKRLGSLPLIAEDLGVQDAPVKNLLKLTGLPGMLVWQFCSEDLGGMTVSELERRVLYSGTHDNQTLSGWCSVTYGGEHPEAKAEEIIEKLYGLPSRWVITPLQDILGLGDDARMNTPGTAFGNWAWRAGPTSLTDEVITKLRRLAERHGR